MLQKFICKAVVNGEQIIVSNYASSPLEAISNFYDFLFGEFGFSAHIESFEVNYGISN